MVSETLLKSHHLRPGVASSLYAEIAKELFRSRFGIVFFVKVSPRDYSKSFRVLEG
jgi:hypothetical protein